jgi:hypothetical protein
MLSGDSSFRLHLRFAPVLTSFGMTLSVYESGRFLIPPPNGGFIRNDSVVI